MTLPSLAIAALGGTLSMQAKSAGQGVVPSLGAETLLASVPELQALARVKVETLCLKPSASLNFEWLIGVLHWAQKKIDDGASGVVVTSGTDTLEECAFFLDLLWDREAPLVLTGAMRSAAQLSADGPANLFHAALVALAPQSKGRGVLVTINGQVHDALHVRKTDSLALDAFTSPLFGPSGLIVESRVAYLRAARSRKTLPTPQWRSQRIALLEASLSADTLMLDHLIDQGFDGVVIAGFGAGHVSECWAEAIGLLTPKIPVIIGTRTGSGSTAHRSYGFVGSEMDLIQRGARMAGFLCPRKARILLWLLIGSGQLSEIESYLEHLGGYKTQS